MKTRPNLIAPQETTRSPGIVIVDNKDPGVTVTGAWTSSTTTKGYYGTNYLSDGNTGQGAKSVRSLRTCRSREPIG